MERLVVRHHNKVGIPEFRLIDSDQSSRIIEPTLMAPSLNLALLPAPDAKYFGRVLDLRVCVKRGRYAFSAEFVGKLANSYDVVEFELRLSCYEPFCRLERNPDFRPFLWRQ